jgi:signal transduction histidine kinase/DNA-binding response OmpR family regulator
MNAESRKHRVLAVDDEPIVLSLVRDAVENEHIEVCTASKTSEAVSLLQSGTFDLLITDIRMPGMDGIQLANHARAQNPDIGIIFMTGFANLDSAKDAIKQGALDYIMKPFELTEIRQSVRNALEKVKREAAGKNSGHQLDSLTDFSHMLHSVSDPASLVKVSLNFAMLQCKAKAGAVLFGSHSESPAQFVYVVDNHTEVLTLASKSTNDLVAGLAALNMPELHICISLAEHPFTGACDDFHFNEAMKLTFGSVEGLIVSVPLSRREQYFGMLLIALPLEEDSAAIAQHRFMRIAAGQLSLSLENLVLLEQSRAAYAKLKELQDQTIDLERMAARGEMSAEIGHELNNFVGVITGNISLAEFHLAKGNFSDIPKYIAPINETIEKIKRFTGGLMDMKSISSRREIVSLDKLLAEVIDYLKPQKRFRGVTIQYAVSRAAVPVDADPTHLQQLLYNMFNNAADAMIDSPTKEITACLSHSQSGKAELTIADTGCGIDPELLKKAFSERFTTKKTGHGYGLIVCKRIIETYGGTLQVESTVGKGTRMSIAFPIHSGANQSDTARIPVLV